MKRKSFCRFVRNTSLITSEKTLKLDNDMNLLELKSCFLLCVVDA